ncbi:MAG: D-aminoacylase [Cyclobacteriaceae bacterium]|nr:D-aminoacylase [Cyclobacteriaceae bacterium]
MTRWLALVLLAAGTLHAQPSDYDWIIRHAVIYDGSGQPPVMGDVGIAGDTIRTLGDLSDAHAANEMDVHGLALAPGFINMLSWADAALVKDGRSMSDLKQGVTLEVFGEGWSPGPKFRRKNDHWSTLGEFMDYLERKGVSVNFASFVGATSVRNYVLGQDNRPPNADELARMQQLVRNAMEEGAMGLGSSLIYAPADYASTEELIALCKVVSESGGMYITHMRSESDHIYSALREALQIATEAKVSAEIYHLKVNHERNWPKMDTVLMRIDSARRAGLRISANMYTYNASGTGMTARIPTWVQEGGIPMMVRRLKDPAIRGRVLNDLKLGIPTKNADPKDVRILGFRKDSLNRLYRGKSLEEVAALHGRSADDTMLDLLIADRSTIPCIFFLMSEDNVRKVVQQPWVSFCSDAASVALPEPGAGDGAHPRMYGSFARLLAHYVRDEKLLTVEEAIRRLATLPATNLGLQRRGALKPGYFADLVVFDPNSIQDHATFDKPHQYATGVHHVWVNGKLVLRDGEHTGAMPGRSVRGPGYKKKKS